MANYKWYLLVDTNTNTALDYSQLPAIWNELPGMHELTDVQLATLGEWCIEGRGYQFLTLEMARALEVNEIDPVINTKRAEVTGWLRTMRDPVLAASDVVTVSDRWSAFDSVSQEKISKFRRELRDITEGDIFNPVWPIIPAELKFLKRIDLLSSIAAPSDEFMHMFTLVDPVISLEESRAEQYIRLREYRDARRYGGTKIQVNGKEQWFWNDEPTRTQYAMLDTMIRRNNLPSTFVIMDKWKTMSGNFVEMTVELLYQIIDTGIQTEQMLFVVAENHRKAIMESDDPTNYNFKIDWPPVYSDTYTISVF